MAIPKHVWTAVRDTVCLRNDVHEDLDLSIHAHRAHFPIIVDTKTTVRVQLRRVKNDRSELWDYLQMWPRTLRVHGIHTWVICWVFGDVLIYAASPFFVVTEWIARKLGRKPLED